MKWWHAGIAGAIAGLAVVAVLSVSVSAFADVFRMLQPARSDILQYSDQTISIYFVMRPATHGIGYEGISFLITNKSDHAIAVNWDRSSITLPNGNVSNVIHESTLLMSQSHTTPPTTIPPGGRLSDSAFPTRNVNYRNGWTILPMGIKTGLQFGLYLTFDDTEDTKGYSFTFEAVRVESQTSHDFEVFPFLMKALLVFVVLGLISVLLGL